MYGRREPFNQHHRQEEREEDRPRDEYAGLMSIREREWLINIQRLQLEGSMSDPYVEDYYAMCYNSKKLLEAKNKEKKEVPVLLVVDKVIRRPSENTSSVNGEDKTYYPKQFEGALGKLQALNLKTPRQLLNVVSRKEVPSEAENTPLARKELTKLRKLLMDIERLYSLLLKIDHEDKKMAGLPMDLRGPSLEKRQALCVQLFQGITIDGDNGRRILNMKIASIRKGCALIFRSLQYLSDNKSKAAIIADLLKKDNFHLVANQKDKSLYGFDYQEILVNSIRGLVVSGGGSNGSAALMILCDSLDDPDTIIKCSGGHEIIEVLMSQVLQVPSQDLSPTFVSKWTSFVLRVSDGIQSPDLKKFCKDSLTQLSIRIQ